MRYNVLWIDDQHDEQPAFIALAADKGIQLIPFKTSFDGMAEYEGNMHIYDAVLLDAKVFDKSENESPGTEGLMNSIFKLNQLQHKKFVPFFVYTGQPDLYSKKEFEQMLPNVSIYKKPSDNNRVIEDLKLAIDKQPESMIRSKHQDVFNVFRSGILPEITESALIGIMLKMENSKIDKGDFNTVRDVLEVIYKRLNADGFLPNEMIVSGKVNLEWSYRFLSGLEVDIKDRSGRVIKSFPKNSNPVFPSHISRTVEGIKQVTSILSHEYSNDYSKYSLYNVLFGLFEILIWLKSKYN